MYFDQNNNYFEETNNNILFDINKINFNRNTNLYSIEEGFNKGNMFDNLYSKYKNYMYKLKVNNKKDELLYKLQMYTFALKDLNLYLDVHPTDDNILNEYHKIRIKLLEVKNEYETKYGPLCSQDVDDNNNWNYINNPWPWDKGGN